MGIPELMVPECVEERTGHVLSLGPHHQEMQGHSVS